MCERIFVAFRGYVSWSEIFLSWNIFIAKMPIFLEENPHKLYST